MNFLLYFAKQHSICKKDFFTSYIFYYKRSQKIFSYRVSIKIVLMQGNLSFTGCSNSTLAGGKILFFDFFHRDILNEKLCIVKDFR